MADELRGLDLKKFSEFSELYPAKSKEGSGGKAVQNPFGAAASEFIPTPFGSGPGGMPGVIDNPFARIQTGLPAYDNMVAAMYPTPAPPAAPAPAPAPVPLRSKPITSFSPAAQAYLAKQWAKIGAGAAMPATLGDFLTANLAYRQSRSGSSEPRAPRPPSQSRGENPFGPLGGR